MRKKGVYRLLAGLLCVAVILSESSIYTLAASMPIANEIGVLNEPTIEENLVGVDSTVEEDSMIVESQSNESEETIDSDEMGTTEELDGSEEGIATVVVETISEGMDETVSIEEEDLEVSGEIMQSVVESVMEEDSIENRQNEVVVMASSSGLNTAMKNKILSLKSKFPEGVNWDPNGNGWNNRAWECYGFAITMAGQLFKDYPTNAHIRSTANGKTVEGWTCYYVTSSNYNSLVVEPGDILDCPTSSQWNHTAMVLSVDNGKITCVQANNGGNNYVYWTQCFNYNSRRSTLKNIYNDYASYITGSGSKVFRLWKPSEALKIQSTGYTEEPSKLAISDVAYPGEITVGSSWTCKGTISSNYTINQVSGYILGSDNSTILYSKTINPNSKSYSLANGDVDKALLFNKLAAGAYYYKITAKDTSGKSLTLVNTKFSIISPCDFVGEITVNTSNGSMTKYSSVEVVVNAEDNNEIENITLSVTGPGGSEIEFDKLHDEDFGTKREIQYRVKYTEQGNYTVGAVVECGNGELHEIVPIAFTYYKPECNFVNNCVFNKDTVIKYPNKQMILDVCDDNGIYCIDNYIYIAETNELAGKWRLYGYQMQKEGNRYWANVTDKIGSLPEGKYREKVEVICNNDVVHELDSWEFEYKFPIITFINDEHTEPVTVKYDYRTTFIMPNDPVRRGYIFDGWYTERDGEGKKFTSETEVKDDLIVYANWIIDKANYGDILPEDIPSSDIIPNGIWFAGIDDYTYTSNTLKQSIRVYDGKKRLKENIDYTVTYKNNKNAYTYNEEDYLMFEDILQKTGKRIEVGTFNPQKAPQIVVKMKGNYSGKQVVYFKIYPKDILDNEFKANVLTATYTGKKQTPTPKLTWNGKTLKYGTDFYIPEYDASKKDKAAFKEAGTYNLTITGKKNFTGEIPITLTISESKKQIAMNKVTVKGINNLPWTGETLTQTGFTVKYNNDVLSEENGDYTISWGTNRHVGTGTVTFTGTGQDIDGDGLSYIGTKTVSFKITGTNMSKIIISDVEKSYTYTGTDIEPIATLTYKANKNAEPITLREGTHYKTTYQKNLNKGTATILFTGIESGGYTGTKKHTFKIIASGVSDIVDDENTTKQIQIAFKDKENIQDGIYVAPYMKGGAKPEVVVTSGEKILEEGRDYKVSYSNNKKVALSTDAKAPTVTVTGKGNYNGMKSVTFSIKGKTLTNENGISVVAKDKVENLKKNGYRQAVKVYDADGKALSKNDYDTANIVYTLIETTDAEGKVTAVNKVLDKNSVVFAGSIIQITVQGKGIYAGGEATGTYRILENSHDISKATIQIDNQTYTGSPVLITDQSQFKEGKVFIKIGKEKKELILGTDIEVVPGSYVKNVNKGTAKVTFRGINDFGGTKSVSFQIGKRSIEEFWQGIYAQMMELWN